jgi:hypothetical protein
MSEEKKVVKIVTFEPNMKFVLKDAIILYNSFVLPKIPFWDNLIETHHKTKNITDFITLEKEWNFDALYFILFEYCKSVKMTPIEQQKKLTIELIRDVYIIACEISDFHMRRILLNIPINYENNFWPFNSILIRMMLKVSQITANGKYLIKEGENIPISVKSFRKTAVANPDHLDILMYLYLLETNEYMKNHISTMITVMIYYTKMEKNSFYYMNENRCVIYRYLEEIHEM